MVSVVAGAVRSNLRGWFAVGVCFFALCTVFSARTSLGLMMPFWEADPGWSRGIAATAGSGVLILMAISAPVAGLLVDRVGPRAVCLGGLLFTGAGVLLTAAAGASEWQLFIFYSLLVGMGSGAVAMPMVTAVAARFFSANQGLAGAVGFSGATGGQLLSLPTLGILVTAIGWRGAYTALGATILAIAVIAFFALWHRGAAGGPAGVPSLAGQPAASRPLLVELWFLFRNRTFLLLLGGFTICGFTTAGVIEVHFIPYAATCGFLPTQSANAYGVHGATNLIGVILSGLLADRLHRPGLLACIYFARSLLFLLLLHVTGSLTLLFLFTGLFGLLNFATVPVIANIVATHLGVRVIGTAMGMIFAGHWVGAAIGSFLGGQIYAAMARYDWLWLIAFGLAVLAGALSLCVPETRGGRPAPQPA